MTLPSSNAATLIAALIAARHDMPTDWPNQHRHPSQRACPDQPWMPGVIGLQLFLQHEKTITLPTHRPLRVAA